MKARFTIFVSSLFLVSGATALAYQVIWFKRFSYVWGNSALAMAAVVASFLAGLAVGAHWLGRFADRVRSPLAWYALCEMGIAVFAIAISFELPWLRRILAAFYPALRDQMVVASLVRFVLTFLAIGPPCILMGGTLPLLTKELTSRNLLLRESTAWLYGINTAGAAAGCYIAGFHLLPSIGLAWTNLMVALTNVAVAGAALLIARTEISGAGPAVGLFRVAGAQPSAPKGTVEARPVVGVICVAAGLAGCAALILEVAWTRQLSVLLGGSTYAFTAMLFVVLLGIALGSFILRLLPGRIADSYYAIAIVITVLAVSTAAGKWLLPFLTFLVGAVRPLRLSQPFNAVLSVGMSGVLEFLPAVGMGILFPLFVHWQRGQARHAGRTVGTVLAWNTAGALIGAAAGSVLLVPIFGVSGSIALALGLYMIIYLMASTAAVRGSLTFYMLLGLVGAAVYLSAQWEDPRITNKGMYMYGYRSPRGILAYDELLFFEEGASANVMVTKTDGTTSLRVNGKVDASDAGDMDMQVGLAYFPRFLFPEAQNVLVIGYGSGSTAGASLQFPGTRVLTCEIEPAVFAATGHFSHVNHRPEESERFEIVFDDGRSFIQATEETFDLIVSEPSNPWMAGVTNLFSQEFYEAVKARLNDGGVLAQWLQVYLLSVQDYTLVARTVTSIFPHAALVRVDDTDTIILASMKPLRLDERTMRLAQSAVDAQTAVKSDLQEYYSGPDVRSLMLSHLIMGEDGLRRLADSDGVGTINTDMNLRLEFDAPLQLFGRGGTTGSESINSFLLRNMDPEWTVELFRRMGGSEEQIEAVRSLASLLAEYELNASALRLIEFGLGVVPGDPYLTAERLILADEDEIEDYGDAIADLLERSPIQAERVARSLWETRHYESAAQAFARIVQRYPESGSAWATLAEAYDAIGESDKADGAFGKALRLDPFMGPTREADRDVRGGRSPESESE